MSTSTHNGTLAQVADAAVFSRGSLFNLSGVAAALLACVVPLLIGVGDGWGAGRIALYAALALAFVALMSAFMVSERAAEWLYVRRGALLTVAGALVFLMQVTSGDPYLQPLAFTVPFVIAAIGLPIRRALLVGLLYLGLMVGGIWLGGPRDPQALLFPMAAYGALMLFMYGVVQITLQQTAARRAAGELAAELARERDTLAALAAENERLAAEAAQTATLAERNRIARELHDTIAQGLTALAMQLDAAQRAFERDPERARARLARAHELARETLGDVRRSVWILAAPLAAEDDLGQALADLARRFEQRTGIATSYRPGDRPLALSTEQNSQILRVVQEALQNIEKHARAQHVAIEVQIDAQSVTVAVADDGVGFSPEQVAPRDDGTGFGLISLRERARLAGAELRLASAPGQGTRVEVTLAQ